MMNETAEGLPRMAFIIHPTEPATVIRVYRGESGYEIEGRFMSAEVAQGVADQANGPSMTKAKIEAMLAGSMFGWNNPAADPENYEEDGTFKKLREYDIAFQGRVKAMGFTHRQACEAAKVKLVRAGVDPSIYWGGSIGKEV